MATYWHKHPRFANECYLFRCEREEDEQALRNLGYERLTVAELRRHVQWVNGENESWGSNRAFGRIKVEEVRTSPDYLFVHEPIDDE